MSNLEHKIEAHKRSLKDVLSSRKYMVDYFQRDYNWGTTQITELVFDLTSSFLSSYEKGHARSDGADYANYYLGSFIVSEKDGKMSIIDGQQRLTSMTLLLIYLNNRQKEYGLSDDISSMIFSEVRGDKSFNIYVNEATEKCLDTLFKNNKREADAENSSVLNMYARYEDISDNFPNEIDGAALPFFIDWVKENIMMVEIRAYSDDNCYAIFESMNNRGLSLTQADLLKGFILSGFSSGDQRDSANALWIELTHNIRSVGKKAEDQFFTSWIKSQYANTYRPIDKGAQDGDFEIITKRMHKWMYDNAKSIGLDREDGTFDMLVHADLQFYAYAYIKISEAAKVLTAGLEHVYYARLMPIYPVDLQIVLMLAPLKINDDERTMCNKVNMVADYIETESVRKTLKLQKTYKTSDITVYDLVTKIRNKSIDELKNILEMKFYSRDNTLYNLNSIRLTGKKNNKQFIKFLLSRMSVWIDNKCGVGTTFNTYFDAKQKHGKPYEIEHIWADKYDQHRDEFDTKEDFKDYRSKIGNLVLLPHGTNQSYGSLPYTEKLRHYIKENTLVKALCDDTYHNNPNFTKVIADFSIPFRSHSEFKKQDILDREKAYLAICRQIWSDDLTPPE